MDELKQFLELFSWSKMTIAERSDILRNIGLLISAIFGLFFLAWRAISNDRIASAALDQAKIATGQLQIANSNLELQSKQVEATREQVLILSKNTDHATKVFQETVKNNLQSHFYDALKRLAEAENEFHRIIAIILVGESVKTNKDFFSPALNAFSDYARAISPSSDIELKRFQFMPQTESDDTVAKLNALKSLPLAFWLEVKASLDHFDAHDFLHSFDVTDNNFSELQEKGIELLWHFLKNQHPSLISHFWYEKFCKTEIKTMIRVIGELKRNYPHWPLPLSKIKFDGGNFTGLNFSHAQFIGSSLRGIKCYQTIFSNVLAVNCDFQASTLIESDFSDANLVYSDFNNCNLEDAVFTDADVTGCRFTNCKGFEKSQIKDAQNADKAIVALSKD